MALNIILAVSAETVVGEPKELTPGTVIQCGTGNSLETFGLLKCDSPTTGGIYSDSASHFVVLGDVAFYDWQSINGGCPGFGHGAYIPLLRVSMEKDQVGKAIQYMPVELDEEKRKESPRFTVTGNCIAEEQLLELQGQFAISRRV